VGIRIGNTLSQFRMMEALGRNQLPASSAIRAALAGARGAAASPGACGVSDEQRLALEESFVPSARLDHSKEARNTPFALHRRNFPTVVLRGVRNISEAP
jgi:hypothetical protein